MAINEQMLQQIKDGNQVRSVMGGNAYSEIKSESKPPMPIDEKVIISDEVQQAEAKAQTGIFSWLKKKLRFE